MRSPRTISYQSASPRAVHERSPEASNDTLGVSAGAAGVVWHHSVLTVNGFAPVEEKVTQPMFSPQARPLNSPVDGSMLTPAVEGAKLTHPTFSAQA